MSTKNYLMTIAAVCLVGSGSSAYAGVRNFHGNICQAQEGSQVSRFRHPGVGMEAVSSGYVECPLVTDGKNITDVEVNVRFTSIAQATRCSVVAVNWDGIELGNTTFIIPMGSLYKKVSIPDAAKGLYVSYTVGCGLPIGQVLTSINVYTP